MPWKEETVMSLRQEFVTLFGAEGANRSQVCRRFGISRKTGYKIYNRYLEEGSSGLQDRSRRPHHSPGRTPVPVEEAVLRVRDAHPCWGGRKIRARLLALAHTRVPSASTITAILQRNGRVNPEEAQKHKPFQRFEMEEPNQLWQMDYKGHFPLAHGRCHPLTVLDDCSRFLLGLQACGDETSETVQARLTTIFRRYGLPERILVDNGSPWGSDEDHPHTRLTSWLIRLGISVIHSRPYHPQTIGKDERLHRTLKAEVLAQRQLRDLQHCQKHFDRWRHIYNFERPHEALRMAVPASRYRASSRDFPENLPPIEYAPGDMIRKVQANGVISCRNREFKIGRAFIGYPVALRHTLTDDVFDVFFCHEKVAQIDLNEHNC